MPNIELAMSDKQIILRALGFYVQHDSDGYWCAPRDNKPHREADILQTEAAAWGSVEIDANFVFREIVPFMVRRGYFFNCAITEDTFDCAFEKIGGTDADDESYIPTTSDLPTVETAILQAFISYCQEQGV